MDCGIPFCHQGCPLGNLIPEWNDLVWRDGWHDAIERLHATNNFPEFTGRLCPAPCESACVLGINEDPVTIKQVEVEIVDRAWDEGWIKPLVSGRQSGRTVAVVGSGPAGLAAAQQLTRAGHTVVVYERADRIGGLLRYGIPEFKMEKRHLDRRLAQMEAEGTQFRAGVNVGVDITAEALRKKYDVVVLAGGATIPRDLPVPGRDLDGIHFAMEFLPLANMLQEGDSFEGSSDPDLPPLNARDKHVVILGGGDTGADCLGTSIRQGAASVTQLEILPRPPESRSETMPWPTYPMIYRVSSAHEEAGERLFSVSTKHFNGDGRQGHRADAEPDPLGRRPVRGGSGHRADHPVRPRAAGHGLHRTAARRPAGGTRESSTTPAATSPVPSGWATNVPGVFVAGDMGRGQSLIVWAIAEGRACAAAVDEYLSGETALPAPIRPTDRPLV